MIRTFQSSSLWGCQVKERQTWRIVQTCKVMRHFHERMWICVSDDFEVERLLNEMLRFLKVTKLEMTDREAIVKRLQECLKG